MIFAPMDLTDIVISFDFDDTLSLPSVQEVARVLISEGYSVVIVTSRKELSNNSDVYEIAKELDISNVTFTNHEKKCYYLSTSNVDVHIDNDKIELVAIQRFSNVAIVDVTSSEWELMLNQLLDR